MDVFLVAKKQKKMLIYEQELLRITRYLLPQHSGWIKTKNYRNKSSFIMLVLEILDEFSAEHVKCRLAVQELS